MLSQDDKKLIFVNATDKYKDEKLIRSVYGSELTKDFRTKQHSISKSDSNDSILKDNDVSTVLGFHEFTTENKHNSHSPSTTGPAINRSAASM